MPIPFDVRTVASQHASLERQVWKDRLTQSGRKERETHKQTV